MASGDRRPKGFSSPPCFAHEFELSDDGYHINDSQNVIGSGELRNSAKGGQTMTKIWLRRAYGEPGKTDGQRLLVDRLWPRGISKQDLQLDDWLKEIAPSDKLRQWFGHDVERWCEFQKRYENELDGNDEVVKKLLARLKNGRVTLIYAAKDEAHNNAVVLREYLQGRL